MPHDLGFAFQQCLNALQLAGFYLPLALAFAIMQALTRRIFLSFGDMAMFASFAAVYVCLGSMVKGFADLPSALFALFAAMASGAALGAVVARLVLGQRLLQAPLAFMIASIGLAIILQEVMRLQSSSRDVWVPPLFQDGVIFLVPGSFPVKLSVMSGLSFAVAVLAVLAVLLILGRTRFGLQWQACSQSLKLASLCGIDATQVAQASFALAGALAGVTGWTSAIAYGGANFSAGLLVGFKAMFASVIGGFGTLRGAALGAVLLAVIEVAWSSQFSTAYRDVAIFAIIICILVLRPEGLLGIAQQRESESP